MAEEAARRELPALIEGRAIALPPPDRRSDTPPPFEEEAFAAEPPIEIVINPSELREKILDYLGAVLARCWIDRSLLGEIERDAHRALRHLGILLPDEIEIRVERPGKDRPRLVIFEWDENRRFKRRICYLQLIMMAGK